ncbi:MAG TPA: hypothetical protein VN577_23520 [Terriglobales bacterium]|nr:hypothetical protein [Terriglobales bacterium]
MDVVRITAGDSTSKFQRAALVLRTIGWLSIVWGCMISIWIWMGEKAGSQLWLWWTLGQFAFGGICLGAAGVLRARAAVYAGRSDLEERGGRAA